MAALIAAVILAAGPAERLGRPKQRLIHRGTSLLRHTVDCARTGGCAPILVVLGARAADLEAELEGLDVQVVRNRGWREGVGSSVRAGVRALGRRRPAAQAVLLLVCDQPRLTPGVVRRMRRRFESGATPIVACAYAGTVGVPALFARELFPELLALAGEVGAKPVLERHSAEVTRLSWPDGAVDIDRPEDCVQLE